MNIQECLTLNSQQEKSIRDFLPPNGAVKGIANFYFVFSDSTRLKILSALSVTELCVLDLCVLLEQNQTTISHQLKLLRDSGIVESRREGRMIMYRIVNPFVNDVMLTGVDNLNKSNGIYSKKNA
ncbi:MAG: metalloregulator ArsR/SmtB family transcription factor [Clostridia bacterium]